MSQRSAYGKFMESVLRIHTAGEGRERAGHAVVGFNEGCGQPEGDSRAGGTSDGFYISPGPSVNVATPRRGRMTLGHTSSLAVEQSPGKDRAGLSDADPPSTWGRGEIMLPSQGGSQGAGV